MITDSRFYTYMTGDTSLGNMKYSKELKDCIEEAGNLCLDNLKNEYYQPIMMLGNIQSGKTRAFIGLMSLCFDNGFDMTIILTKCSKALVQQTVSRMTAEFDVFKSGNATVGDVVAQDILDVDFKGTRSIEDKKKVIGQFLGRYRGKKRIIVVKKQADNVDRMNMFIEELILQGTYKRILIVDDEADITSIGYERMKGNEDVSLRRISGAINTMRKSLHSNIEYVLMQVTATPYALYLQPESFSNENIMSVKPRRSVVVPTGKGYIGGQFYFLDSQDPTSDNYVKAKHLFHEVEPGEMDILNGSKKNSGKNSVINDKRVVKMTDFIKGQSIKKTFKMPALRSWLFNVIVGAAILQLNPKNEGVYISCVLHAATSKSLHRDEGSIISDAIDKIQEALLINIDDQDVICFLKASYDELSKSVESYGILQLPSFTAVQELVATINGNGTLEGIITEIDIKEVNSDNDITTLLNNATGELKLENSITIFVGGQVLDRGITIPNMIGFFYGRDPVTMQQDTVMQHCRMFGYRTPELLSITRFYTTLRLFQEMREITERDNILRNRMIKQTAGNVIYLKSGGKIKACSPQKILASQVNCIMPEKRYLPVGFEIVEGKIANRVHDEIYDELKQNNAILGKEQSIYRKGEDVTNKYVSVSANVAFDLIEKAYKAIKGNDDGKLTDFCEVEPIFWFSLSEQIKQKGDNVALIIRTGRELSKTKDLGKVYQDAPDDGNNEGALAKELRKELPVLVLVEQKHKDWKHPFWWPIYYTPCDMNVGIYAEELPKTGVGENLFSMGAYPIQINEFIVSYNAETTPEFKSAILDASTEAKNYFEAQFKINGAVTNLKKRRNIECTIFIYEEDPNLNPEFIKKELYDRYSIGISIINEAMQNTNVKDELMVLQDYIHMLNDKVIKDELRERALMYLDKPVLDKVKTNRIARLIREMEDILDQAKEIFGYFLQLGDGKCEIGIYYKPIYEYCKSKNIYELDKAVADYGNYVAAHEIFHALHYADVMTESGRWLCKKSAIVKQGAVKEGLAEYFALSYAKDIIYKIGLSKFKLTEHIRETRSQVSFPDDGGYSGALILENKEGIKAEVGNENYVYCNLYRQSLSDMITAYQNFV